MKWAIQAKEEEKNKPQTFSTNGWTGNQRSSQMWWRNERELLSSEPRTARTSELNGSGGERGKGIRGPRSFVPVEVTNRNQRLPFIPVGATNRDKRVWPPYPLPSPSARAIQLTCSCCFWLGRGEFLLISSPHLWKSLIPRLSIGAKGLGLIFLFFLGFYSSFHALEIEKNV